LEGDTALVRGGWSWVGFKVYGEKISIDFFQSGQRKNIEIYTEKGGRF